MPMIVYRQSDSDFRTSVRTIKRAIIPVGSLEQHGPHLPVSTDSIIVERIAQELSNQANCFVLPAVSYGISFEHMPMFNISVRSSTLTALICDACISLGQLGIRQIVILNGHHGNSGALQHIAQELYQRIPKGVTTHVINYWQMMEAEFDHAGQVETSLVLAIAPELVRMEKAEPSAKKLAKSKAAYRSITCSPGSFPEITGNGVWGDPRKATANYGHKLIEEIVNNLKVTIEELFS